MQLIPVPPEVPPADWVRTVAVELMKLKPELTVDRAMRCAELAHECTWLLPPDEAAHWWMLAINASTREHPH